MSSDWKAPPKLKEPYSDWKVELEIWQNFTSVEKGKQGGAVFLSLPNPSSARDAVLQLGSAVINSETAVAQITAKLDTLFLTDTNILTYQAWKQFIKFKRPHNMNMKDYSIEFNKRYNSCKAKSITLPESVLAIQFLESANLPESQHKLALATCSTLDYKSMSSQVLKITTDIATSTASKILPPENIKIESPTFAAESEKYGTEDYEDHQDEEEEEDEDHSETLYGYRYGKKFSKPYSNPYRGQTRGRYQHPQSRNPPGNIHRNSGALPKQRKTKQLNATDKFGRPLQCRECLSIYHLEEKCPEIDGNIVLLTDEVTPTSKLLEETLGCMVVDSGCIHTVCGTTWIQSYIESLSCKDRKTITTEKSTGKFRFGNGTAFESLKYVTIPVYLGKSRIQIGTDVVDCDIPLLFSKNSLKKGKGSINFEQDTIQILNQKLKLEQSSTGHYFLRLARNTESPIEEVKDILFNVKLDEMDEKQIQKVATKWHKQFAHPPAQKLINLLKRANVDNETARRKIEEVTANCNICLKYRKAPNKPIVAFPLASRFNETVALDLKDIRPGIKILHMVDHATRYAQACVVKNKTSTEIIKKIFDIWIRVFGCPEQVLTDNGGEFNNWEFLEACEKCNIRIKTTAAESPWSNGMVEKHNGILGHIVEKMLEDEPLDPEIAIHWAVAAKNSLATVYGFSPNILVFGKDPNIPVSMDNKIPANDPEFHSQLVKDNLNALHKARESFIHQESAEKLSRALNRQTRTYSNQQFLVGDEVYYKREKSSKWQGTAKVLGRENNQLLIKHGSSYLRVHPCRLLHANENRNMLQNNELSSEESEEETSQEMSHTQERIYSSEEEENSRTEEDASRTEEDASRNEEDASRTEETSKLEDEASSTDESFQEPPEELPEASPRMINTENPPQAKNKQLGKKSNLRTTLPNKNEEIQYRLKGEAEDRTATCLGRGGRASSERTWHYINIHDHDSNTDRCISVIDDIESWKSLSENNETLLTSAKEEYGEAKDAELQKWKNMNVYEEVENVGQNAISTRWVCTERLKAGKQELKARLCARGCEDYEDVPTDSPTCERDNVRLLLTIAASNNWTINSMDIKSAYLQGEPLDREIFLKPPKEAKTEKLWKLNKCVYGINDAGKKWYNQFRKDLLKLGTQASHLDQAVFYKTENDRLTGMMVLHVDDTLWTGDLSFKEQVIEPIRSKFLISAEEHENMRYLGLSISSDNDTKKLDLNHYTRCIKEINLTPGRKNDDILTGEESKSLRVISGQLNWLSTQCRPDISFNSCQVSCLLKQNNVSSAKAANKTIRKAKGTEYPLSYLPLGDPNCWRIIGYSDASWGNLPDGGSQGGYLIFIIGDEGRANLISWQSRRLRRIARSTIAAETLAAVDACEACLLISSQLSEILKIDKIPITLITDNESLANAVRSTTSVEEKRLRVDISALREMLNNKDIDGIKWTATNHMLADCLTKQGAKVDELLAVVHQQMVFDTQYHQFVPAWYN